MPKNHSWCREFIAEHRKQCLIMYFIHRDTIPSPYVNCFMLLMSECSQRQESILDYEIQQDQDMKAKNLTRDWLLGLFTWKYSNMKHCESDFSFILPDQKKALIKS